MNAQQIGGIVRAVVAPILAFMAGKGVLVDSETGELIIVAASAVATAVWSVFSKRR